MILDSGFIIGATQYTSFQVAANLFRQLL